MGHLQWAVNYFKPAEHLFYASSCARRLGGTPELGSNGGVWTSYDSPVAVLKQNDVLGQWKRNMPLRDVNLTMPL